MKTVQMTLDEELIAEVDELIVELKTTRSAFTRDALRMALERHREKRLEERHRAGYAKASSSSDEFAIAEEDRAWGDGW